VDEGKYFISICSQQSNIRGKRLPKMQVHCIIPLKSTDTLPGEGSSDAGT